MKLGKFNHDKRLFLYWLIFYSKKLTNEGGCHYYHKVDPLVKQMQHEIWDIEDLVENGRYLKGIIKI